MEPRMRWPLAILFVCLGLVACSPGRDVASGCAACSADAGPDAGPVQAGTFVIAEWNLDFFGNPQMGPANEVVQASNVASVMGRINADLWALEEVCDPAQLDQVLLQIKAQHGEDYGAVVAGDPSIGNADPGFGGDFGQKTAVVYRKSRVTVLGAQLVQGAGWDDDFVRRRPLELQLRVRGAGDAGPDRDLIFIAVHLKAGAEASSYALRQREAADLKAYLDADHPGDPVLVVGDWNDDLDQSITCEDGGCRASPFRPFLDDAAHYRFPTQAFDPDQRTTVHYASAIDHHLITDELFGALVEGSAEVFRPAVSDYGASTSDHFPTVVRYWLP
jgi:hypothetical protein